jgi:hypothetical protein
MPESASPEELVRAINERLIAFKADWNADEISED